MRKMSCKILLPSGEQNILYEIFWNTIIMFLWICYKMFSLNLADEYESTLISIEDIKAEKNLWWSML
jgi:hypothetical protein